MGLRAAQGNENWGRASPSDLTFHPDRTLTLSEAKGKESGGICGFLGGWSASGACDTPVLAIGNRPRGTLLNSDSQTIRIFRGLRL